MATLVSCAVLMTLGTWQAQRAGDKRLQIAAFNAQPSDRVWRDVGRALCSSSPIPFDQRVIPPTDYVGEPVRFYGTGADGHPGWRIVRAVHVDGCNADDSPDHVVVEADFETLRGERFGAPDQHSIARPPQPNAFTPANIIESDELYRFEPAVLEVKFGLEPGSVREDVWLPAYQQGLPPHLADVPPARHIGYALTWFGLAAVLLGVYLAYHIRAGRLRWT